MRALYARMHLFNHHIYKPILSAYCTNPTKHEVNCSVAITFKLAECIALWGVPGMKERRAAVA